MNPTIAGVKITPVKAIKTEKRRVKLIIDEADCHMLSLGDLLKSLMNIGRNAFSSAFSATILLIRLEIVKPAK